jgi:hypothetical protein
MGYDFLGFDDPAYAFYTRYPLRDDGWPTEAEDLTCPKCGAQELVCLEEAKHSTGNLGDRMQCWICKHEFVVTENCWKWREIGNG